MKTLCITIGRNGENGKKNWAENWNFWSFFGVFGVFGGVFGQGRKSKCRLIDMYVLYWFNAVVYTVIL